jgi:hypothetical protein
MHVLHKINTGHTYSTIIAAVEVLHKKKKGQLLNTLKLFDTYKLGEQEHTFADTVPYLI